MVYLSTMVVSIATFKNRDNIVIYIYILILTLNQSWDIDADIAGDIIIYCEVVYIDI
jgi:hypothetical protein